MNQEDLTSLLRATSGTARDRTSACPDEERLAAFVDGDLASADAEALQLHLADCESCLATVGFLARDRNAGDEPVSETDLARARQLVKQPPARWTRLAPARWATAAVVLVAIGAVTQFSRVSEPTYVGLAPEARTTRNSPGSQPALQVLIPGAGDTVNAKQLEFRWSEVPGSRYYDVRIVTEAGDLVVEQRVAGTDWQPADSLHLNPGSEYFVHVEAHPSEAKTISSDHVPFLVSD